MNRALLVGFVLGAACVPDLGDRDSHVEEITIVAVRGEPPEAKEGDIVHYDILVATPNGALTAPLARWDYCRSAKLLTENGAVSAACLHDSGVTPISTGTAGSPSVNAAIPMNACNVFGPNVLTQDVRPRDPDITGGYFQPLRVIVEGKTAFGLERVGCGAPLGPSDVVLDFTNRYQANKNPTLDPIVLPTAQGGAKLTLRATWPESSAEPYVVYDLVSKTVVPHRESMRVSWFATAGMFDADRTGRAAEETQLFTENGWTAPAAPQIVHFFVVLRDPRGGTAFTTFDTKVP